MPEEPTREGYEFLGWWTRAEETGGRRIDGESLPIKDFTVYARWKINKTPLELAREKLASGELIEVDYTPQTVSTTVTIDSASNNNQTAQNFTQASVGATGSSKVSWYVLDINEDELILVSSVTLQSVQFSKVGGYNNCLYFLNQISTELFYNEEKGVTKSRVHALRLTDIRDAAVSMNGASYNWDTEFVNKGSCNTSKTTALGNATYSSSSDYRQYPSIYGTSTGTVNAGNELYDETPGNKITNNVFTTASSLTVKNTYFNTQNNANTLTYLGEFGRSGVGKNLFNSSGTAFWLASRCVNAGSGRASFHLRSVYSGYLSTYALCDSGGGTGYSPTYPFRCVVSIPGSWVNVSPEGTISIK